MTLLLRGITRYYRSTSSVNADEGLTQTSLFVIIISEGCVSNTEGLLQALKQNRVIDRIKVMPVKAPDSDSKIILKIG